MIRVKISNFIKRNKDKISDLGIKLIIVAIIVFIATIILSFNRNTKTNTENENKETFRPTETIQKGANISEKQYVSDNNTVEKFMEYCNNKNVEEAYNLISDACKEKLYPTIDAFRKNYYNSIFNKKREYNLQSWISTKEYTVYKIRYTNDMLSTGIYEDDNVYQDYITLIKNSDIPKISIGNLVISEKCNIETRTDNIDATVIQKTVYLEDEEYEMYIKNKTDNTILLDTLETDNYINLVGESGELYNGDINKIFTSKITITPGETKRITLRFKKMCSSNKESKYIQFSRVIKNYEEYINNKEEYKDTFSVKIKL